MAVFDWMAPPQTYWTPPEFASGATKVDLALGGFNSDGTKNGWGNILSHLPIAGPLIDQKSKRVAKDAGLDDVANNIQAGIGQTVSRSQIGLGALATAGGLATGNWGVAQQGVQMALGGMSGAASQSPQYSFDGTQNVQYF